MRAYKCLNKNHFTESDYSLTPIRDEDKYAIMEWRNTQIDILRQQSPLTKEGQEGYFKTVIEKLFEKDKPEQILWSFLLNDHLIGYGGLVHIDWEAKHGEISFVLNNERNNNVNLFEKDWSVYLNMISQIAFNELGFNKIHTYAYNIRDYYFKVLYEHQFEVEGRLKGHILINNKLEDILVLSKFKKNH